MARRRTFIPQQTFGDDYHSLVMFLLVNGFSFSLVDIQQCKQDTVDQREERAARNEIEAKYREAIVRFTLNQRERYGRYIRLLNAARAAFRDDPAMLVAIEGFARKRSRRSTSAESPPTVAEPKTQP